MKDSGNGWRDSAERYERERLEMTPAEKRYEREHSFSGSDWYKLFLVLVVLYYVLKIIGAIIE